jgi:hypothetical protein
MYDRELSAAEVENNFLSEGLAVDPSDKLGATWGAIKASNLKSTDRR